MNTVPRGVDAEVVLPLQVVVQGLKMGAVHMADPAAAAALEQHAVPVAAGVAAARPNAAYYAIHDGARPLVRPSTVDAVIAAAVEGGAAAAAVPVKDTIKEADENGFIAGTLDRSRLWNVQTPQVFSAALYRRAMEQVGIGEENLTDDCQLVERLGHPVRLCRADYANIKITTPEDVAFAEAILRERGGE